MLYRSSPFASSYTVTWARCPDTWRVSRRRCRRRRRHTNFGVFTLRACLFTSAGNAISVQDRSRRTDGLAFGCPCNSRIRFSNYAIDHGYAAIAMHWKQDSTWLTFSLDWVASKFRSLRRHSKMSWRSQGTVLCPNSGGWSKVGAKRWLIWRTFEWRIRD